MDSVTLCRRGEVCEELLLPSDDASLFAEADRIRREYYGNEVYIRGLIEITNYCKNNCYYCGIRRDNREVARYRLDFEEILECCHIGYDAGFRTFVLQGGEDPQMTDLRICRIVSGIRNAYPDCAVTLSLGEKSTESYREYFRAGASRYLLRHETADEEHYAMLHPSEMSAANRKRCLYALREIGYQVGAGFMVGSPWQTNRHLLSDLRFLRELSPDMIGIGPFLPHHRTPFADREKGSLELTLRLIAILRILFPYALIPATTALATLDPRGRVRGLCAGANVVMPNLSPNRVRGCYSLYENKKSDGAESAEGLELLRASVSRAGYRIVTAKGDVKR